MPGIARFSKRPPKKDTDATKGSREEPAPSEAANKNFGGEDDNVLDFNNFGNDGMDDDFGFGEFGGMDDEEQGFDPFDMNFLNVGGEQNFNPVRERPDPPKIDGNGGGGIARFQRRPTKQPSTESDANTNGKHGTEEPNGGYVETSKDLTEDSPRPTLTIAHNKTREVNGVDSNPTFKPGNLTTEHGQGGFRKIAPSLSRFEPPFSPKDPTKPPATPNHSHLLATNALQDDMMSLDQPDPALQDTNPHSSQGSFNNFGFSHGPPDHLPQKVLPVPLADQKPSPNMAPPPPRFAFMNQQMNPPFNPLAPNMPETYANDGPANEDDLESTGINETGDHEPPMPFPFARRDTLPDAFRNQMHATNDSNVDVDEIEPEDPWSQMTLADDETPATEKPMEEMTFAELVEEFDKNMTLASDKDVMFQSEFLAARVAVGAATSENLKFKGLQWEFTLEALELINEMDDILLEAAH